ncbi:MULTISPECIES: M23 family metallopeptidase [Nocardia]|uniref:M23 family metallopeptidase n=1 Tax=Nocardia coubleae TaxID=356147 RepID=A0A846VYF3_9NOCA|nr:MULTISPECIES: M23 family metallopeptidase [Nocardia]NKX85839.1 M23 family metallopeptidase [Nocardia coubleae]
MFVTNPLSARISDAFAGRLGGVVAGAVALSALVGTSAAAFSGPETPTTTAVAASSADALGVSQARFTSATAPEVQAETPAAAPVAWEEHREAIQAALPPLPAPLPFIAPPPPPRPQTVRPVNGRLTSYYGPRWGAAHNGIDFGDPIGAPVFAVTDGTVIETGPASGFGLWVRVQQDDGTIGVFGHVNEILVQPGQHVNAGDVIATVGNRGQSTGPHLHYEVHVPDGSLYGAPIDPHPWLAARGIDVGVPQD